MSSPLMLGSKIVVVYINLLRRRPPLYPSTYIPLVGLVDFFN